jgi:alpha-L-arabinofuranosidase
MLAKRNFTQWKTDMIFFDNVQTCPTPNYYVQKMFSANQGDRYYSNIVNLNSKDSTLASSCVTDGKTGDIIIKLVNAATEPKATKIDLNSFQKFLPKAELTILAGPASAENTFDNPKQIMPVVSAIQVAKTFNYTIPAMSLTVIRIKTNNTY